TFAAGSSDTVTAAPNGGYTFVNWTQNGSQVTTSPSYTFTVNSNVTLVANFTPVATQYTVAVSASPSAGGTVSGAGTFAASRSDTVTATANSRYTFFYRTANGSVVSTSPSYTFTVNSNVTLVANFTPVSTNSPANFGETTIFSSTDSGNGNLLLTQDVSITSPGTLQSLSFYVKTAAGSL